MALKRSKIWRIVKILETESKLHQLAHPTLNLYYYLPNSLQNRPDIRLVYPKPQNRKYCQRTARYMAEASLPIPIFPCAFFFFLSPAIPTTQRHLCGGERFGPERLLVGLGEQ